MGSEFSVRAGDPAGANTSDTYAYKYKIESSYKMIGYAEAKRARKRRIAAAIHAPQKYLLLAFLNNLTKNHPKLPNTGCYRITGRLLMRTAAQMEASKRNGAKSKGPITSEGRARSSQNAIRHGLTAQNLVVIDGESKEEWENFQRHFLVKFQPRDFVEERMVLELAVCRWRLERIWKMQVAIMNLGVTNELPVVDAQYENFDVPLVHACAHTSQRIDVQSLDQLETRLSRRYDRALRNYNEIRAQFPPQSEPEDGSQLETQTGPQPVSQPEIAKLENEPNTKIQAINIPRPSASLRPQLPSQTPQPTLCPENNPI